MAISDGHTGSTDVDIFRRSAVCVEVEIPADMDCAVVELSDVTILRRRSPQGQDSAEHQEGCSLWSTLKLPSAANLERLAFVQYL